MAAPDTRLTPPEPAGAAAVKASAERIAPRLKALAPEAEKSRRLTREGIDLVRDHVSARAGWSAWPTRTAG